MNRDIHQAFSDIALLFELSLSVSQSLDLKVNCQRFLGRVMARKNLSQAALWVRRDALPPEMLPAQPVPVDGLALVYSMPHRRDPAEVLPGDHVAVRRAVSGGAFSSMLDRNAPSVPDVDFRKIVRTASPA